MALGRRAARRAGGDARPGAQLRRRRARGRGVLAARQRPRAGPPAAVGRRPGGLARRRRPRRRDRRRRPRGRPARPALRVLRLGRDDRPDPARDRGQAGGDAQLGRLRRPARGRPAVDRRRARRAAPRAAGPARPAARPARRADGAGRRRRRPHAQRRRAGRGGRRRARPARAAGPAVGRAAAERPRAAGTLGAAARAAGGARVGPPGRARPRPRRAGASRAWWSTGPPRASPRSPRDGRAGLSGLAYAGDLAAGAIARGARGRRSPTPTAGGCSSPSRMAQNAGPVLAASEEPSIDAAVLNPFPDRGSDGQTVAVYDGIERVTAPVVARLPAVPGAAAVRGARRRHRRRTGRPIGRSRRTATRSRSRSPSRATSRRSRLLPYNDRRATVTAVEVQGRRFDVKPGWNTLEPDLRDVRTLSVRIADVRKPDGPTAGAGGIRELVLPGVEAREALRPPTLAERALPRDTRAGLTYLFQRTTGDDPFRRTHERGSAGAALVRDRLDGETRHHPRVQPARGAHVDARRLGEHGRARRPRHSMRSPASRRRSTRPGPSRAARPTAPSSAFDGTAQPWIGSWLDGRTAWLSWTTRARPRPLTTLRLHAGARRPAPDAGPARTTRRRVAVAADGTRAAPAADPRPRVPARRSCAPRSRPARRERRASGAPSGSPRCADPACPTVERPAQRRARRRAASRPATIGDHVARWRLTGTIEDLDAGPPAARRRLRAASRCPPARPGSSSPPASARAVPRPPAFGGRRAGAGVAGPRGRRRNRGPQRRPHRDPARPAGAGAARARRELQPRPARDLRRPGPRRAGGRRGLRRPPGASRRRAGT